MTTARYIIVGLGTVTAIAAGAYFYRLNQLGTDLEVAIAAKIHKVSLKGVDVRIDVTLKNPTAGTVKVKHPFLRLIYKDSTVASSTVKDLDKTVPAYGEVVLDPIMINVGLISLASSAPSVLTAARAGKPIDIVIEVQTMINNSIPFKKSYNVQLSSGKAA
jgi:hypothetical protein